MASGSVLQLILPPKSMEYHYANELTEIFNFDSISIPTYGDFIHDIIIHTDQPMPPCLTLRSYKGEIHTFQVQIVIPGWYRLVIPILCMISQGLCFEGPRIPIPNQVYINFTFINRHLFRNWYDRSFVNHGHVFPVPVPVVIHISKLPKLFGHETITHVSWKHCQHLPISLKLHGITRFEILNQDYRTAAEIICHGQSCYNLGYGLSPRRLDHAQVNIHHNQKQIPGLIRSSL